MPHFWVSHSLATGKNSTSLAAMTTRYSAIPGKMVQPNSSARSFSASASRARPDRDIRQAWQYLARETICMSQKMLVTELRLSILPRGKSCKDYVQIITPTRLKSHLMEGFTFPPGERTQFRSSNRDVTGS